MFCTSHPHSATAHRCELEGLLRYLTFELFCISETVRERRKVVSHGIVLSVTPVCAALIVLLLLLYIHVRELL